MAEKKCICDEDKRIPKYYEKKFFGGYKERCERCYGFIRNVSKKQVKEENIDVNKNNRKP